MSTIKTRVGGAILAVDEQLKDWGIFLPKKPSSMVAYIGVNSDENKMYLQWNKGSGTFYGDVPIKVLNEAVQAESIGKFWHASIKGKFEPESEITSPLISLTPEGEEDDAAFGEVGDNEIDW